MGSGAQSEPMIPLAKWKKGLFTHEDTLNVHKLLGLPCLAHFIFRTLSVPFYPFNDMRFDDSNFTALIIVWHLALSVSSLIFRIPKVRIKEGSRIWPEFRLHSIVFACRSLATMSVVLLERRTGIAPQYWANVAIVFATLLCADLATASVDPLSRSNTIRGLDTSAAYKFAFSFMQFLGTTGCLVGLRSYAAQFAIVFIIQTYAFTLTLRRKNLVSHNATVFIYSYQLSLGGAVAQLEIWQWCGLQGLFMFPALAACAMLLRVGLGMSKYLVWGIMGVAVQYARKTSLIVPPEERYTGWPEWAWPVCSAVGLTVVYGLFWRRSRAKAMAAALEAQKEE